MCRHLAAGPSPCWRSRPRPTPAVPTTTGARRPGGSACPTCYPDADRQNAADEPSRRGVSARLLSGFGPSARSLAVRCCTDRVWLFSTNPSRASIPCRPPHDPHDPRGASWKVGGSVIFSSHVMATCRAALFACRGDLRRSSASLPARWTRCAADGISTRSSSSSSADMSRGAEGLAWLGDLIRLKLTLLLPFAARRRGDLPGARCASLACWRPGWMWLAALGTPTPRLPLLRQPRPGRCVLGDRAGSLVSMSAGGIRSGLSSSGWCRSRRRRLASGPARGVVRRAFCPARRNRPPSGRTSAATRSG